jgi:Outer membrane protein beta-barrel domain
MRVVSAMLVFLIAAGPVSAQIGADDQAGSPPQPRRPPVAPPAGPSFSIRAFGLFTEQQFAAPTTFEAIFGSAKGPFFGGGAQVVHRNGLFAEVGVSRFKEDGERAFRSNGESFRLGIPLSATITPIEITGGYRFRLRRHPSIVPYAGAGVGSYGYRETSGSSDDVDTRHVGYLAVGGVEVRVHRWIAVGIDGQYTHIPGILGTGGISEDVDEKDLGGTAVRVKFVVGR